MPERIKTVTEWMADRAIALAELVSASGMDERVVKAIVNCRWTPSPEDRRRLAAALGVETTQVAWGHQTQISHVHGHGPQFGRSP
jgi:ribosome-binding protein aMBF1 (putative translation factor)